MSGEFDQAFLQHWEMDFFWLAFRATILTRRHFLSRSGRSSVQDMSPAAALFVCSSANSLPLMSMWPGTQVYVHVTAFVLQLPNESLDIV